MYCPTTGDTAATVTSAIATAFTNTAGTALLLLLSPQLPLALIGQLQLLLSQLQLFQRLLQQIIRFLPRGRKKLYQRIL